MRRAIDETFYALLVGELDCGPFDGGCVVVALALVEIFGGEVMVLVREDGIADHAVARIGDQLVDWDGPETGGKLLERFNHAEMASCVGWRPMEDRDLGNAPRNPEVVEGIRVLVEDYMDRST